MFGYDDIIPALEEYPRFDLKVEYFIPVDRILIGPAFTRHSDFILDEPLQFLHLMPSDIYIPLVHSGVGYAYIMNKCMNSNSIMCDRCFEVNTEIALEDWTIEGNEMVYSEGNKEITYPLINPDVTTNLMTTNSLELKPFLNRANEKIKVFVPTPRKFKEMLEAELGLGAFKAKKKEEVYSLKQKLSDYLSSTERFPQVMMLQGHTGLGKCLIGSTKIRLMNGESKSIEELTKTHADKEFFVYSFDVKKGRIVPGLAHSPRVTKYVDKIVKVTLDNGEVVECTPEHPWLLKDGSYVEAQNLKVNESIMPFYSEIESEGWFKVYERVLQPITKEWDCIQIKNFITKFFDKNPKELTVEEYDKAGSTRSRKQWVPKGQMALELGVINHKIVSVETICYDTPIPVYDMTVDKYQNFALECGVFVHNSAMIKDAVNNITSEWGYRLVDIRCAYIDKLDIEGFSEIVPGDADTPRVTEKAPMKALLTATDAFLESARDAYSKLVAKGKPADLKEQRALEVLEEYTKIPIIFFDEITRMPKSIRNSIITLLDKKRFLDIYTLNEARMIAATNYPIGMAEAEEMSEMYLTEDIDDKAFLARIVPEPITVESVAPMWFEWAEKNLHPDIISYVKDKPDRMYNWSNIEDLTGMEAAEKPFVTFRGWENVSNYLFSKNRDKQIVGEVIINILGTSNVTVSFISHLTNLGWSDIGVPDDSDSMTFTLEASYDSNVPAMLQGVTSLGKTARVRQLADQKDAEMYEVILSQVDRTAVQGNPTPVSLSESVMPLDLRDTDVAKELAATVEANSGLPSKTTEFIPDKILINKFKQIADSGKDVVIFFDECFTGDTKVSIANGTEVAIKDLVDKDYFYVYSYDTEKKEIVIGKGHSARVTRKNAKLLKITLDNGEVIKCTENHPFLTHDNEYVKACELKCNQSLMSVYHLTPLFIPEDASLNRKVVSVEDGGYEDAYDITVDKYHNFALSAGVIVHNCNRCSPTVLSAVFEPISDSRLFGVQFPYRYYVNAITPAGDLIENTPFVAKSEEELKYKLSKDGYSDINVLGKTTTVKVVTACNIGYDDVVSMDSAFTNRFMVSRKDKQDESDYSSFIKWAESGGMSSRMTETMKKLGYEKYIQMMAEVEEISMTKNVPSTRSIETLDKFITGTEKRGGAGFMSGQRIMTVSGDLDAEIKRGNLQTLKNDWIVARRYPGGIPFVTADGETVTHSIEDVVDSLTAYAVKRDSPDLSSVEQNEYQDAYTSLRDQLIATEMETMNARSKLIKSYLGESSIIDDFIDTYNKTVESLDFADLVDSKLIPKWINTQLDNSKVGTPEYVKEELLPFFEKVVDTFASYTSQDYYNLVLYIVNSMGNKVDVKTFVESLPSTKVWNKLLALDLDDKHISSLRGVLSKLL